MSLLKSIERAIEGVVERGFGRVFRSPVQPVELARKLAREMEAGKQVSVRGIYGPNEFVVYLSHQDREGLSSYEGALSDELVAYLTDHAAQEQLTLVTPISVRFVTDSDLRVGEFGIAARVADAPEGVADAAAQPAATPVAATPPRRPSLEVVPTPVPDAQSRAEEAPAAAGPRAAPGADQGESAAERVVPALEATPLPGPIPDPSLAPIAAAGAAAAAAAAAAAGTIGAAASADPPVIVPPAGEAPAVESPAVEPPRRVPRPPVPTRNDQLEGVQGTQVITPEHARAAGLVRDDVVTLVVAGERHRLAGRVTRVGRSRESDVMLQDSNVSRLHFEIRNVGSEFLLVDMRSTNGTYVNGKRVSRAELHNGDVIDVGTTRIQVERT